MTDSSAVDVGPRPAPEGTPPSGHGPLVAYRSTAGTYTAVDTEAVTDNRERAICRALLDRALKLLDDADEPTKNPVGFS